MVIGWRFAVGAVVVLGMFAGCERRSRESTPDPQDFGGLLRGVPMEKPDFALMSMHGSSYDFRQETEGYVTLVFFGYTYCPDVCPIHMSSIASVKRRLTADIARQIKVVFVTTDPDRDTPLRLQEWLGAMDADFIGLLGTPAEIGAVQMLFGIPTAYRESEGDDYSVAHSGMVFAFTKDNLAHLQYPFGTRQSDWARDLPRLVERGVH